MIRSLGTLVALAITSLNVLAQTTLGIGDPAPKLQIEEWIQHEPIPEFMAGHVYVVEFWATWCPPCKKSIPHLTDLQKRYENQATIIGISAKDAHGESVERVRKYVQTAGETMNYTVAFDDGSKTNQAYMVAARQRGIPTAFVIDKGGRIAWIGHPMMGLDEVLERVVKGDFTPSNDQRGDALAREVRELIRTQRTDESMQKIDDLVAMDGAKYGQYAAYKFAYMLTTKQDRPAAYDYAAKVTSGPVKNNPKAVSAIALAILLDKDTASRKLDVALDLANRAAELTERKDASILATLAHAHFESGDFAAAIQIQTIAVEVAKPTERKELENKLAIYQKGK